MLGRIGAHVRQQWMGALALFLVLSGGVAYAGATITGADVQDGSLTTADYKNNDIRSGDVRNDTASGSGLSGLDIQDQSGVDTCTHGSARLGELCVTVNVGTFNWLNAQDTCAAKGLRVPSFGEAWALAQNHDIPSLGETELFWTEEKSTFKGVPVAHTVSDDGGTVEATTGSARRAICVTTPTN
jgi:hypothetical protein